MNQHARNNAVWAGIAAVLMLFFGWGRGLVGMTDDDFYNTTVAVFEWMLKVGGFALLVVAGMCFAGLRAGLLVDVFVSGIVGLIMVLCSIYWLGHGVTGGGFDIQDIMFLVFGFMFLNAARGCWVSYQATGGPRRPAPLVPSIAPRAPEPIHPASLHPDSLPKDGEPPPPDGYLAALAKEKDEPPRASFE